MGKDNHLLDTIKSVIVPIHPAGLPFIAIFAVISLILGMISNILGFIGIIATAWCVYFFRNPKRITPQDKGLIISPADGIIHKIETIKTPEDFSLDREESIRISVFLNVFDVHINRVPIAGKIIKLKYYEGKFLNAALDKASTENERQLITMQTDNGHKIGFSQIAGLVARRIICELKDGQELETGEIFGLIRFGSRMDVYLPIDAKIKILVGQKMIAGETILADISNSSINIPDHLDEDNSLDETTTENKTDNK